MPEESVTVMLQPDDDTETVLERVRRAGAKKISLIVPPGTRSLQTLGGFTMLRKACDITGLDVTVYSTDEKTADMAKVCRFEVVRLDQETRPREVPPAEEELPRIVVSPRPPEPAGPVVEEAAPVTAMPAGVEERLGELSADDLALFNALEDMSLTEDVELTADVLRRPSGAVAAHERPVAPPEEVPAAAGPRPRKGASFLGNMLQFLASALGNVYMAVVGLFLGVAARVTQRKATPAAAAESAAAPLGLRVRTAKEVSARRAARLRYYLGAAIAVVGFTLLLVLIYSFSQPTVVVALTPRAAETQEMDLALTLVMTDAVPIESKATVEGERVSLAARPLVVQVSRQASGPATGRTTIPDTPATGVVVVTNPDCAWAIALPAGTRVWTPGGIGFHTTQDAVVPARVEYGSAASIGIAWVSVAADLPGSAANVDPWAITGIDDPSGCLRVVNEAPTTGGSEHEATIVTAEDQDLLRRRLQGLPEEAEAELVRQLAGLEAISKSVIVSEDFSHAVGSETAAVTLTLTVQVRALGAAPGALEQALRKAAELRLGGVRAGRQIGEIDAGPLVAGSQTQVNIWTYHTHAVVPLLTVIDDALKAEIAAALDGKTPRQAQEILAGYQDRIASFSISPVIEGVLGTVQVVDASTVKQ